MSAEPRGCYELHQENRSLPLDGGGLGWGWYAVCIAIFSPPSQPSPVKGEGGSAEDTKCVQVYDRL